MEQPIMPDTTELPEVPELTQDGLPNPEATDDGRHAILQSMFQNIDRKHQEADNEVIIGTEKIRQMKKEFLTEVFDMLKKAGVDPNDPEQINAFLEQLASSDPDLLALFEDAFNGLLPDSETHGLGGNLLPNLPVPGEEPPMGRPELGQPRSPEGIEEPGTLQEAPAMDPEMLSRIRGMVQ